MYLSIIPLTQLVSAFLALHTFWTVPENLNSPTTEALQHTLHKAVLQERASCLEACLVPERWPESPAAVGYVAGNLQTQQVCTPQQVLLQFQLPSEQQQPLSDYTHEDHFHLPKWFTSN